MTRSRGANQASKLLKDLRYPDKSTIVDPRRVFFSQLIAAWWDLTREGMTHSNKAYLPSAAATLAKKSDTEPVVVLTELDLSRSQMWNADRAAAELGQLRERTTFYYRE